MLEAVYPPELSPTRVRATAVGFAVGVSRIGSALSTFAFPLLLNGLGAQVSILLAASISVAGLVICLALAPETRQVHLTEVPTASARGPSVEGRPGARVDVGESQHDAHSR